MHETSKRCFCLFSTPLLFGVLSVQRLPCTSSSLNLLYCSFSSQRWWYRENIHPLVRSNFEKLFTFISNRHDDQPSLHTRIIWPSTIKYQLIMPLEWKLKRRTLYKERIHSFTLKRKQSILQTIPFHSFKLHKCWLREEGSPR